MILMTASLTWTRRSCRLRRCLPWLRIEEYRVDDVKFSESPRSVLRQRSRELPTALCILPIALHGIHPAEGHRPCARSSLVHIAAFCRLLLNRNRRGCSCSSHVRIRIIPTIRIVALVSAITTTVGAPLFERASFQSWNAPRIVIAE